MTQDQYLRCIAVDPQDQTVRELQCPIDSEGDAKYEWLRDQIKDYIETTPRYFDGTQCVVILDESGRLKDLPRFVITTDQGPEDLCGTTLFFGAAITAAPDFITPIYITNRIQWISPAMTAKLRAHDETTNPTIRDMDDIKYFCKIVVANRRFYTAVWSELFVIDPELIDPLDTTKYTGPGPVTYAQFDPQVVGLVSAAMDPIFRFDESSPQKFRNARFYMNEVRKHIAAQVGIDEEKLIEVPFGP